MDTAAGSDLLGIGLVGVKGLAIFWGWVLAVVAAIIGLWVLLRNGKLAFLGSWLIRVPVLGRALLTFDEAFKAKTDSAREAIVQGRELHAVLRDTGLFLPETIEAVELGEESGRLAETLDKHFRVLRMRVKFAMAAIAQIASSVVWIAVAAIMVMMIFRLFGRYVAQIDPGAMEVFFNNGNAAGH